MTAAQSARIWFDARIKPNSAMSRKRLALVAIALLAPPVAFSVVMILIGAWPVTFFLGGEAVLAAFALYFCAKRLSEQDERVLLTDESLVVEAWDRGTLLARDCLEPAWLRIERCLHPDFGCECVLLRSRERAIRVGEALSPPERLALADAIESALHRRKRRFALEAA